MQCSNVLCISGRVHSASQGSFQLDGNLIIGRKDLLLLGEMQDGALEKLGWLWRTEGIFGDSTLFWAKTWEGHLQQSLRANLSLHLPICKVRLSLLMFGWCFEIPRSKQIITAITVPSIIVMCWNWSQNKQGKWLQINPMTSVWTEHPQNMGLGCITSVAFAGKSQKNKCVFLSGVKLNREG